MSTFCCEDWRDAPAERIDPLYDAEIKRWAALLEWDAAANFEQVELGRRIGHVRGVLAIAENGAIAGWSFYLANDEQLQVGGFVSASEACTQAMLAAIFGDEAGSKAVRTTFFAYSDAPGLAPALRTRGQIVDRYFYMARDLTVAIRYPLRDARRWSVSDIPAAAELMRRAYPASDAARPFAPAGTPAEWTDYVTQIATSPACGQLVDDACVSVSLGPDRLCGVVLVSRIAPSTAHLVQLATDPTMRRRGLGSALLLAACSGAHRGGFRRMTIMVSGKNAAARRLYQAAGFEVAASFIAAGATQPRRSTSVAGSGVAASRR
jgi:ribosomal protein S18 acetylase RimI-like enzyme